MEEQYMSKGDNPRPVDRKKWDDAPYWQELEKRKRKGEKGKAK